MVAAPVTAVIAAVVPAIVAAVMAMFVAVVLAMAALTGPATAQPAPPEVSVERAGEVFLVAYDLPSDAPAGPGLNPPAAR